MLRPRHAADDRGNDGGGGSGCPAGPAELQKPEYRIHPAPKSRTGLSAHEPAHNRLTGVERVAASLFVEHPLQENRYGGYPKKRGGELRRDTRPDEPFAAANCAAEDDRPGASHAQCIAQVVLRWRR